MKNHRIIVERVALCVLSALMITFIFLNSSFNADISSQHSSGVLEIINQIFSALRVDISLTENFVRKSAHFVEYFVLGVLLFFTVFTFLQKISLKIFFAPFIGLIVSIVDETIQFFTPGRSCQFSDMMLDFSAVCTAFILTLIIIKFIDKIKIRKYKNE